MMRKFLGYLILAYEAVDTARIVKLLDWLGRYEVTKDLARILMEWVPATPQNIIGYILQIALLVAALFLLSEQIFRQRTIRVMAPVAMGLGIVVAGAIWYLNLLQSESSSKAESSTSSSKAAMVSSGRDLVVRKEQLIQFSEILDKNLPIIERLGQSIANHKAIRVADGIAATSLADDLNRQNIRKSLMNIENTYHAAEEELKRGYKACFKEDLSDAPPNGNPFVIAHVPVTPRASRAFRRG